MAYVDPYEQGTRATPRVTGAAQPRQPKTVYDNSVDPENGFHVNSPEWVNAVNTQHPEFSGGAPTPTTPTYNFNWLNAGYDRTKLADQNHKTAKYQIGRTLSQFDPHGGVNDAVLQALNALGFGSYYGSFYDPYVFYDPFSPWYRGYGNYGYGPYGYPSYGYSGYGYPSSYSAFADGDLRLKVKPRDAQVFVDDKPQPTWDAVLDALGMPRPHPFQQSTINPNVLTPGERVTIIKFPEDDVWKQFRAAATKRVGDARLGQSNSDQQ